MEYTEGLMRELENLEIFEKTDSLTEIGKKRIVALRKCRDDFKKLHLPDVSQRSELLKFLVWFDDENDFKHYPNINEGIVDKYLKL
jgi:hypothetical protein